MKRIKFILLLLAVGMLSGYVWITLDNSWVLRKETKGVKVYTRKNVDASSIKEVKVSGTFQNTMGAIIRFLQDKPRHSKWVYHCKVAKELKRISEYEQICYQIIELPWPCENRDMITNYKVSQDSISKIVTIQVTGLPNYIPAQPNLVRIQHVNAKWTIVPNADKSKLISYTISVNPGGNIPAWLINMGITDGPLESLINMQTQLKDPQYSSVTLPFIKE